LVAVAQAARAGIVAPDVPARARGAERFAQLGDVARGLVGLVRARDPIELVGTDDAKSHCTAESKNSAPPVSGGAPYAYMTTSSSPWFADCSTVPDSTWTTPPVGTSTRSGGSPRYIVSVPERTTNVSS